MQYSNIPKKLAGIRREIKAVRIAKGISQEKLAAQLNTSQNIYSKIERGEIEMSIDRLMQITDALDMDIIHLLEKE
jgi:transcriptional regulator with XRE-family HTH domain